MAKPSTAPDVTALKLAQAGRFAEALDYAQRAIEGAQSSLPGHGLVATILKRLGRTQDAEQVVEHALTLAPGTADAYDSLAFASMLLGRHQQANALYRRVVELAPQDPRFWYNLASSERSLGRLAEAEAACDRAIALDATHFPSYLLRSELRLQTPDANHVEELTRRLGHPESDDRARMFLGYALGKELDDLGRYEEAFRWFDEAASTRRRHLSYDVAVDERKLKRIAEVYPAALAAPLPARSQAARFVFVVGLPRSGTTLLERILTGLPGVHSNGETENFSKALLEAAPSGAGDVFSRAAEAKPEVVAARYATLAGGFEPGATIVEKLPMNFLYLGAIGRALPEAAILLLKRSPLDSCFAMYRTLFGAAYPFTYDFGDLAAYYAAYEALMRHWQASVGDRIHEVVYEDLVREPERVGASAAQVCGLPWVPSAIEVEKNSGASLTASAAQVRRPIYGSSSGKWRHYHRQLNPLIRALRERAVRLPADA